MAYNPERLITVYSVEQGKEVSVYDNIEQFCTDYDMHELSAKHFINMHATFLCEAKDNQSFVAYQGKYDDSRAFLCADRELTRVFGKANRWIAYRISENPYPEDNRQKYYLNTRFIYLTKNYLSISNSHGLEQHYPYLGLVIRKDPNVRGEVDLYFKGKYLGRYTREQASEKHIIVSAHNRKIDAVLATPILDDVEPIRFESIKEAADYFYLHETTIRHKIKTAQPVDKDKVFYLLRSIGA